MSDNPIPTPETGPMDDDAAVRFLMTPPPGAAEPIKEEDETDAAPDAEEADEAAPDETSDEPDGDPTDEADEVDEGTDPGDAEDVEYVEVTVNGETREVPLDEAIKGYSRTEDYKEKTRNLAEERRAFEAERKQAETEIAQARARYAAQLAQEPEEPDWDQLRREDPIGYAETYADWSRQKAARQSEQARVQQEHEEFLASYRQETAAKSLEVFPEWRKPGEYQKGAEARMKAAEALGFADHEVNANNDYRVFALLEKAALYDKMVAEKGATKAKVLKKVRSAPKARLKQEARQDRNASADVEKARLERLRKTGSIDDAVAFLMEG